MEESRNEGLTQGRAEGHAAGIAEGARKKALETAKNMLTEKIPVETIAKCTGLSVKEVEELAEN
ncbi:hypothetical protein [Treponema sp.]|uniref:hypothetical protein n=1 Tax=Treponema sp. TaxID=166 RepID=UPI0025E8B82D|nr:hypothetical protein [Treponema sp.]MCR5217071.1 hypothetical protein [Treponema sp.]